MIKTKAELFNYIDQILANTHTLTLDQFYEIGHIHKQLPKPEKSWKELAAKTNFPGIGESYRGFVNRYEKKINEITETPAVDDQGNYVFEELYKERTRLRDTYNNYRASLRSEARLESFKDELYAAIKALPHIKIEPKVINCSCKGTEAILLLSDLHLGVFCDNFYNKYDQDIAKKRLEKYAEDAIYYCKLNNVTKLNVLNLGDLIHGIIHTTARIQEELRLCKQISLAAEFTSQFLATLAETGIDIIYRSCTDNHSRAVANLHENIEEENFSEIIDELIELRLKDTPIKFVNDNIDVSLGKFKLDCGKNVMFAHGHLENVNKCVDTFSNATKEFIDYVILSHFHNAKEKGYGASKVFVNGSIVGTEQYAFKHRLFTPAEQKLLIVDNRNNLIDITINLQID